MTCKNADVLTNTSMERGAVISDCGTYRYRLWRRWDRTKPMLGWVMLNPSTADASVDDATIRRVIGFSKRYGAGGALVSNRYALRSTDPRALLTHVDPRGPDNDEWIIDMIEESCAVVAAWGTKAYARALATPDTFMPETEMLCLGTTKYGYPRHPLFVRGDKGFVPYEWAQL